MLAILIVILTLAFVAALFLALCTIPAAILMLLLGALASLTGWACAIGFLPCLVITLILGLFL